MSNEAWSARYVRCLGVQIAGGKIDVDDYGDPIIGDCMLDPVQRRSRRRDPVHAAGDRNGRAVDAAGGHGARRTAGGR